MLSQREAWRAAPCVGSKYAPAPTGIATAGSKSFESSWRARRERRKALRGIGLDTAAGASEGAGVDPRRALDSGLRRRTIDERATFR
jgi:hypothetical protein